MGSGKLWHAIARNCDCSSGIEVKTKDPLKNMLGPRCPECGRILGIMEWTYLGKVRASTEQEALKLARSLS